jgi:hypothetical protein
MCPKALRAGDLEQHARDAVHCRNAPEGIEQTWR